MTSPSSAHRLAALAAVVALGVACVSCGGGDDNATAAPATDVVNTEGDGASAPTSGGACSLVDVATIEDLFTMDVVTEDQPIEGHCFFGAADDPEYPNAGVTVLRNEFGQVLWDEWVDEVESSASGSGGSGKVDVDVGDEAIAHPGPNAVDLIARTGEVNVRITAEVNSDGPVTGKELLTAATALAEQVI